MKAHEIPEHDRVCLHCAFYMMHDSTCAHPENDWNHVNFACHACKHFETEELYTPKEPQDNDNNKPKQ